MYITQILIFHICGYKSFFLFCCQVLLPLHQKFIAFTNDYVLRIETRMKIIHKAKNNVQYPKKIALAIDE